MEVWVAILLALVTGAVGFVIGWLWLRPRLREAELRRAEAERRLEENKAQLHELESVFKSTASDVLAKSTEELIKLAEVRFKALVKQSDMDLESKKKLIDANLSDMSETLKGIVDKSTRLEEGLSSTKEETMKLRTTTEGLQRVLSSSQKRGQWGERMLEDILRTVGLVEGINYRVRTQLASGVVPDFTFLLPKDKVINLDVKFPIDQYERYIESETDWEAEVSQKQFLSAVKGHLKDVAGRGYVDPAEGTVDYVMVFIPNESIYAFIHQSDPGLLDYALENHIILCSPITLYAMLSLVRQAVQNFALEERAGEILGLLNQFRAQWEKYTVEMEKMGGALDRAKERYNALVTTRTTQLEKPLVKIKELEEGRQQVRLKE